MTVSHFVPLPDVPSALARAGTAPVAEPVTAAPGGLHRALHGAADLVGTLLTAGLVVMLGVFGVGVPIALAVRAVLYLLGQR